MPVIDAHAHIYPDKIAMKATAAIGKFYCIEDMYGEGSVEDLLGICQDTPISHFLVHSVATTAHSVPTINNFIADQCARNPNFIGFGTMHHEFEDMEAEVNRAIELGLHGFKLHPDTQQVNMDDPRLMNFYEIIQGRVPVVIHTGDYRHDYSNPRRLERILKAFPDLVVDAAHFGGWSIYDVGFDILHEDLINAERLFVDTSSATAFIGRRHMNELIHMWGVDRIMFGSDYPMWSPVAEYEEVTNCGLTDDELERVLYRNAEVFTGVKISD